MDAFFRAIKAMSPQEFLNYVLPVLETVVETNDRLNEASPPPTRSSHEARFQSTRRHDLSSLRPYLERLAAKTQCSPEAFIVSLIYMDRAFKTESLFPNSSNVFRYGIYPVFQA